MTARRTLAGCLILAVVALGCTSDTQIQRDSAVPAGDDEVWTGTVHSESTWDFTFMGSFLICTEVWDMQMSFTVRDGEVTGTGDGQFLELRNCRSNLDTDFSQQVTQVGFDVRGTATASDFELELVMNTTNLGGFNGILNHTLFLQYPSGEPHPLTVPITRPGFAEAEITIEESIPQQGTGTGIHEIRVTCESCEEAVG